MPVRELREDEEVLPLEPAQAGGRAKVRELQPDEEVLPLSPDPLSQMNVPEERAGSGAATPLFAAQAPLAEPSEGPTLTEIARRAGVGTEGLTAGERLNLNFGLPLAAGEPDKEARLVRQVVSESRGLPPEQVETRVGPETGRLEFRVGDEQNFNLVNEPGGSFADVAAAAPEIGQMILEVTAGVGGGAVGALSGNLGAAGVGATLAESLASGVLTLQRLREANERFDLGFDDEEIREMAATRAGLAAGGGALGGIANNLGRRLLTRLAGGRLPSRLAEVASPEELETGLRQQRLELEAGARGTGAEVPEVTAGQALRGVNPRASEELMTAEQRLRQVAGAEADPLRQIQEQQNRFRRVLGEERIGTGPTLRARQRQAEAGVEAVSDEPSMAGRTAQEEFGVARENFRRAAGERIDELTANAEATASLTSVRRLGRDIRKKIRPGLLRSLPEETQERLGFKRGTKETRPSRQSLRAIATDLQEVRALERDLPVGSPQRRRLGELKAALTETRQEAAREAGVADDLIRADREFREQVDQFDRSFLGTVLRKDEVGNFVFDGDEVIRKALRNPGQIGDLITALKNPDVPLKAPEAAREAVERGRRAMQRGLAGQVTREAEVDGVVSPGRLRSILRRLRGAKSSLSRKQRESIDELENAILARDIYSRVTTRQRGRDFGGVVDPAKLTKLIEDSDVVDVAREKFGRDYVEGLEALNSALKAVDTRTIEDVDAFLASEVSRGVRGLEGFGRFLRVPFAPLTMRGRALTATVGVLQEEARRGLAEALSDPDKLQLLLRLKRSTPTSETATAVAGALGMPHFAEFLGARRTEDERRERSPEGQRVR